jgi:hypothetical protein
MAYHVVRVTRAARGAAHDAAQIERDGSRDDLAQALATVVTGLAIAWPAEEWER